VFKLDEQISDTATDLLRQYRLSHGLATPDALIAATVIALNRPIISKNQRDYSFIRFKDLNALWQIAVFTRPTRVFLRRSQSAQLAPAASSMI